MSEQRYRGGLFHTLKKILKAQGIRYCDLAELMQVSEPTIKRLFQEEDCKLSRLIELCDILGINLNDLVELASKTPSEPSQLPLETELALAADPSLTSFFMLLISELSTEAIAHESQLSEADVYLYLRELEKLELIRLGRNDSFHFTVPRPIRWRLDGPLHDLLIRINQQFITEAMSNHHSNESQFYSTSRLFSEHSIKQLHEEIDSLYQRFQQQAALDQIYYPTDQLTPYKMVATLTPFNLSKYFSVAKFHEREQIMT